MSHRTFLTALTCATVLLVGCSETPIVVNPRSFERPGKVAFACVDPDTGLPLPLERCRVASDGTVDPDVSLLALVTQTARGEVAAIDLTASRLLDSDPRVPGFTFVPVGELPSDLVVPAMSPSKAYVANAGSRDLSIVALASFRAGALPGGVDVVTVPIAEGAPGALALAPDERTLFVTVPTAGIVLAYPILADGTLEAPLGLALAGVVPAAIDSAAGVDWGKSCPADVLDRPALTARMPMSLGATARPSAVAVDAALGRLLVADAALPVIHVIDIATQTELEPMVVGVPTNDVVLTPEVPVSELGGDCAAGAACTRYVYAIDAVDGSVLVYDIGERAVVRVSLADVGPADRIRFGGIARGLAVMSPEYPGTTCAPGDENEPVVSPIRMRGVFVAVSIADGTVRIVDVLDLDANCRGGEMCSAPANDDDQIVFVRRHRPRIASFLRAGVSTLGAPTVVLDGQPFPVAVDGITASTPAPDLVAVTCPDGQAQAYPALDEPDVSPLVCAQSDPWSISTEGWLAAWERGIPGTQGGRGAVSGGGTPTLTDVGLGFCRQGVLGSTDVPTGDEPEAGYAGDVLAITAALPEGSQRADCLLAFPEDAAGQPAEVLFPIVAAYQGHLELEAVGTSNGGTVDWERVVDCYVELITYEVRTRGVYTVIGDRSRFLHRVTAMGTGPDDRCVVDTTAPRTRVARATPGRDFVTPFLAFHIAPADFGQLGVTLGFVIGNIPPKLAVDFGNIGSGGRFVGSLPSTLRYNPFDRRLYAIDEAARGLVQMDLAPFSVRRTYE